MIRGQDRNVPDLFFLLATEASFFKIEKMRIFRNGGILG